MSLTTLVNIQHRKFQNTACYKHVDHFTNENTRVKAGHNPGTLTQYRTENPDGVKAFAWLHHTDTKAASR